MKSPSPFRTIWQSATPIFPASASSFFWSLFFFTTSLLKVSWESIKHQSGIGFHWNNVLAKSTHRLSHNSFRPPLPPSDTFPKTRHNFSKGFHRFYFASIKTPWKELFFIQIYYLENLCTIDRNIRLLLHPQNFKWVCVVYLFYIFIYLEIPIFNKHYWSWRF